MADETRSSRIKQRITALRERWPLVDRVVRVQEHYGKVQGSVLASSATYFAFLAFFPLLALAFAVVGYVSQSFPDARDSLVTAIEELFPGIVSESGGNGTISLTQIENAKVTVGIIGFLGVLYSGLGWISGLRTALADAFEVPRREKRNFVVGKAVDIVVLVILGVILIASVTVAGIVTGWAGQILDTASLDDTSIGGPLIWVLGTLIGIAVSTVLFLVMYRVLGNPTIPTGPLWQGALVAAVGFETLKILAVNVIGAVGGSAFAPLAIAITLVVWINYFSRLAMYGACWAMTSRPALLASGVQTLPGDDESESAAVDDAEPGGDLVDSRGGSRGGFDAGSAVIGAAGGFLTAWLVGRRRR